jgi:hypothetical protein
MEDKAKNTINKDNNFISYLQFIWQTIYSPLLNVIGRNFSYKIFAFFIKKLLL